MANFNEILIKCRFLDDNGQPKGREYTYVYKFYNERTFDKIPPNFHLIGVPSHVQTEDGKDLVVTGVFTDPSEIAAFADRLKYVVPAPLKSAPASVTDIAVKNVNIE